MYIHSNKRCLQTNSNKNPGITCEVLRCIVTVGYFNFFTSNMNKWFCICMWLFAFHLRLSSLDMNFFAGILLRLFWNFISRCYVWTLLVAKSQHYKQYGELITFCVDHIRPFLAIDNLHKIFRYQKFLCVIFLTDQLTKPFSKFATEIFKRW